MGSLGGAIRGLQVGPASTKDEARLLSGHESTWRLSHPRIRLSRLSFPAQEGDLAGMSIRRFLPARCQPDRAEGDQADDPAVGTPSPERPSPTSGFGETKLFCIRRIGVLVVTMAVASTSARA